MGEINAITDQLNLYVDDVLMNVELLKKDNKLTTGEAIKIVEAGVHNMECEIRWHQVHRICDSIEKLNDTLETIATSISC